MLKGAGGCARRVELHKAKADYLDESFKVNWLDVASARMAELKHCCREASMLPSTCRTKLFFGAEEFLRRLLRIGVLVPRALL